MNYIDEYELSLVSLECGIVFPTVVDRKNKTFTGGVYNQSGKLVTNSLRQQIGHKGPDPFPQRSPTSYDVSLKFVNYKLGRFLYLGFYTEHYGHFLLETLARLWAVKQGCYDGFVFNEFVIPRQSSGVSNLAKDCFESFGIDASKILIVEESVMFEVLDVPNSQFYIGNRAHPRYIDIYREISSNLNSNCSGVDLRVYISRSALNKRRRKVVNEVLIEEAFKAYGFVVVHPQTLSFREQLGLLAKTDILAGLDGSGLHNCVFMPKGGKVINLCGPRQPKSIKSNQKICNELNDIDCSVLPFIGDIINEDKLISRYDISYVRKWLRKHFS